MSKGGAETCYSGILCSEGLVGSNLVEPEEGRGNRGIESSCALYNA